MPLQLDVAMLACLTAAIADVRSRKIPNAIPAALALAALAFAATHGFFALLVALALMIGTLFVGTLLFAAGWLGGGDIKLLAAVNGCLGLADAIPFLLYTAICGGLLGLGFATAQGKIPTILRSVGGLLRPFAISGTVAIAPERPIQMPYALAIGCGVVAVALSHSIAPYLRLPL